MQSQLELVLNIEVEPVIEFFQCPLCEFYKIRDAEEFYECPRCGLSWNSVKIQGK